VVVLYTSGCVPYKYKGTCAVLTIVWQGVLMDITSGEGSDHDHGLIPVPVDNIDIPRWDQDHFTGRLKHFWRITNPLLLLKPRREFDDAAKLVEQAR